MSAVGVIIAGIAGALAFSVFTGIARSMGMTKMSIEKMLGAMFGEGGTAAFMGWVMHLGSGIVFAIVYVIIFNILGTTNGWLYGAIIGLLHGLGVGAVLMPMMGAMHPAIKAGKIEAPGFFGVNAGSMTPMGIVVGHIIFGAVLGGVYFLIA